MISRISTLIMKEIVAVWQDKKSRVILILPPLVQFFVFTFAATLDVTNISLAVFNRDHGIHSRDFIQHLQGASVFGNVFMLEKEEDIQQALDLQKALLVLQLDDTFSREIEAGKSASIQLLADGRRSNSAQIAAGYLAEITERFDASLQKASSAPQGISVLPRFLYNPNLYYPWFNLSGLVGILSMLTCLGVSALSIAREREMGTLDQLLVTPMSSLELLVGKALPAIGIGIFEGLLMLSLGILFLDLIVRGSLLLLVLSLAVFISSIVGVGLIISSIARTQQQATLGLFLVMFPLVIASGFATPVENMTPWLQYAALANPLKYFLFISRGICMRGIDNTTVLQHVWPMLAIAGITFSLSVWFFRRTT